MPVVFYFHIYIEKDKNKLLLSFLIENYLRKKRTIKFTNDFFVTKNNMRFFLVFLFLVFSIKKIFKLLFYLTINKEIKLEFFLILSNKIYSYTIGIRRNGSIKFVFSRIFFSFCYFLSF